MAVKSVLKDLMFTNGSYIPASDREQIIKQLWGDQHPFTLNFTSEKFDSYFNFYMNVCAGQAGSEHALRTHQDFLELVHFMKHESSSTRSQIRTRLASTIFRSRNDSKIDSSLDLALRLWLMVSTGGENYFIPGQTLLSWHDDESFIAAIARRFPKLTNSQLGKYTFSPALTACNLVRLGGFPIKWTCNLVDHLALKHNRLHICHPISVLQALETSPYLPPGLAEETLRTLAVLFPWADTKAHKWLERIRSNSKDGIEHVDPGIGSLKSVSLEIESFSFWRERLLALEDAYDKSEPENLWQWWYDRRNRREWATFWVAFLVLILTIVFGMIQSVTGIIQVVFAIKAYNAA